MANNHLKPLVRILGNERGLLPIFGVIIFLGVVVAILVAVVVGFDNVYQQQSGKSMFPETAKIHEIREKIAEGKEQVKELIANAKQDAPPPTAPTSVARVQATRNQTADERLDKVQRRLDAHE